MNKKIVSYFPQILALLFIAGFAVYAWTEPGQAPPAGNVATPLNVSATAQTKAGRQFGFIQEEHLTGRVIK